MNDELEKLIRAERELIDKVLTDILNEGPGEEQEQRYKQIDHIPEWFKIWESRYFGRRYVARANGCLFCKKCDDIVLDSSGLRLLKSLTSITRHSQIMSFRFTQKTIATGLTTFRIFRGGSLTSVTLTISCGTMRMLLSSGLRILHDTMAELSALTKTETQYSLRSNHNIFSSYNGRIIRFDLCLNSRRNYYEET